MVLRCRYHWVGRTARRLRALLVVLCLLFSILPPPTARADGPTITFTGSAAAAQRFELSPTGSLNAARHSPSATLLLSGKVLVAGGYDGSMSLNSAELYDPASGTWIATGSMLSPRYDHTATLLTDGRVLVACGALDNTTELYDPATGKWSATGDMATGRSGGRDTATLLTDGRVLVAGSGTGAELYDPSLGTWSVTGSMNGSRVRHAATLLPDGRVLVAGGSSSAELYDPTTGTWSPTGSLGTARAFHTATLLGTGNVLVAGGSWDDAYDSAELYEPASGTWRAAGSMADARRDHTATLLPDGRVLVAGGRSVGYVSSAELYVPATGLWTAAGTMNAARRDHVAVLLPSGQVLLAAGRDTGPLTSAELWSDLAANRFTGTLTLPSGWVTSQTVAVGLKGVSSDAAPDAAALSNDGSSWGDWLNVTPGVPLNSTWDVGADGAARPIALRLRDVNGQVAAVVTGTVNVDTVLPTSSMTALPATSPSAIPLIWSGSDATSGVSGYDVQVRVGSGGTWTNLLTGTSATSTTYNGTSGTTYYFRVRATDVAGNVEAWPGNYDTYTLVDTEVPGGALVINHGALATTSPNVQLGLSAGDVLGTVSQMRFGNDGTTWGAWQGYAASADYTLPSGDGLKTVYGQFKDAAGNMSEPVGDTITLDTAVGVYYGVSINNGALFTNQADVTLSIGAPAHTTRMQVSNDNLFVGAAAEPFNSRRAWQITQYGDSAMPRTVYVRWLDLSNNELAVRSDDIVLDVNAPTGSVQVTPGATSSSADTAAGATHEADAGALLAAAAGPHAVYLPVALQCYPPPATGPVNVTLHLNATDDRSGMGTMMISNSADFACAAWAAYVTQKAWHVPSGTTTVYVRFRDNAGNVSATVSDTITR